MFLTYLWRELRRRARQAIFIALGLAVGVGLVITVKAASGGVAQAQGQVLHSLYGIGTDITVTTPAGSGTGGGSAFSFGGGLPSAGASFSRDLLLEGPSGFGVVSSGTVTSIGKLPHVSAATGALALSDLEVSGSVPGIQRGEHSLPPSSVTTNSFTVLGTDVTGSRAGPLAASKLTAGRTLGTADADADVALVDADYALQNKLSPGSKVTIGGSNGAGTSFTVVGVVAAPPGGVSLADVYIPVGRAQALGSDLAGKVNTIYVSAASAADIAGVQRAIGALLPAATVTSSSDLASQVTGSLANSASLANNLGKWLAIAVLAAAFLLASLLTISAVSRRVREFGTLKALGWRSRRVVAQVLGESLVIGIFGGAAGAGLGYGGAALVNRLAPPLKATVGQASGSAAPGHPLLSGLLKNLSQASVHTVSVHLTAQVTVSAVVTAVVLAVSGGLLAGAVGGWRAARLRPAAALSRVE